MTGWDFIVQSKGICKGPIYFTATDGQEIRKYRGLDVFKGEIDDYGDVENKPLYIVYWPSKGTGVEVYNSSAGVWSPSFVQTITIMSVDSEWFDTETRKCITAWLNANATKIS